MTLEQAREHPGFWQRFTEHIGEKRVTWAFGWRGEVKGSGWAPTFKEAKQDAERVLASIEEEPAA